MNMTLFIKSDLKKISIVFFLLIFFNQTSIFSQDVSILSYSSNNIITIKYSCKKCGGNKKIEHNSYKKCSNCEYWTNIQKTYNYCSVCRNKREILVNHTVEICSDCNGRGYITKNISKTFVPVILSDLLTNNKGSDDNGSGSLEEVVDKDHILISGHVSNILLFSDYSAVAEISSSWFNDEFVDEPCIGNWRSYGEKNFEVTVVAHTKKGGSRQLILHSKHIFYGEAGKYWAGSWYKM